MDKNCPGREGQRKKPVKVGRCEKAQCVLGAKRVWVGRSEKGVEKRKRGRRGQIL